MEWQELDDINNRDHDFDKDWDFEDFVTGVGELCERCNRRIAMGEKWYVDEFGLIMHQQCPRSPLKRYAP